MMQVDRAMGSMSSELFMNSEHSIITLGKDLIKLENINGPIFLIIRFDR